MGYVGNYAELSLDDKKAWLKKQRKGTIIGDYRNHLYTVYMQIRKTCDLLNTNECLYEKAFSENGIPGVFSPLECCIELLHLGYINIQDNGNQYLLSIVAEIDF